MFTSLSMLAGDENIIVKKARAGHAESFGQLYDEHHERIYRFIYLKVRGKEEAEDLTHQVFLSAWQNIKQYALKNLPFSSWLYRIARNKVIDYYRLRKQTVNIEAVKNVIPAETDILASADTDMETRAIHSAISGLTPEQQDVVIMRFVEDMPIKEVARSIGKTVGAVKLIQFRAISKLKNITNNHGENNRES